MKIPQCGLQIVPAALISSPSCFVERGGKRERHTQRQRVKKRGKELSDDDHNRNRLPFDSIHIHSCTHVYAEYIHIYMSAVRYQDRSVCLCISCFMYFISPLPSTLPRRAALHCSDACQPIDIDILPCISCFMYVLSLPYHGLGPGEQLFIALMHAHRWI